GGSAATSSSASSRGLRFRARASCIAAGQEKSPCCACLGRSREISEPGCCGATWASARVSNSVRWDLISADIDGPKCSVLYPGRRPGRRCEGTIAADSTSDRERRAWAKAISAHSAARSSRDRTARPDRARRKKRRRNPPDFRRWLKLYRVYVEV